MSKSLKFISRINCKRVNTIMVLAVVSLWMGTLVASNYANHQTLKRTQLDKDINILEEDLRLLDAQVSDLQATRRLESESQRLNLVKVQTGDIFYVNYTDGVVALR